MGVAALIALTLLVYLPSTHAGFIWDDDILVTNNPAVKTSDGLYSIWLGLWFVDYVPVTLTSFWAQWHLWGMNAAGYHITGILLHGIDAALLWRVLRRLSVPGSWFSALLFAAHPVCAASVTWISEQKNTLSMLFLLASLLFYLRLEAGGRRDYGISIIAFILALLSKGSAVILPVILLLCAWWRRGRISRGDVIRILPFFGLAVAEGLACIWVNHRALHGGTLELHDGLLTRVIAGSWAVWFYLGKIFWPANLTMIYPRWNIDPHQVVSYVPALLLAGVFVVLWCFRSSWGRPWLFALGYFIIALGPVLGIFKMVYFSMSQVSDHLQYLAIPGILALAGAGAATLSRRAIGRGLIAALAVAFACATWQHEKILGDEEILWRDNISKNPSSWTVYMNLNIVLLQKGQVREATALYNKAMQLRSSGK